MSAVRFGGSVPVPRPQTRFAYGSTLTTTTHALPGRSIEDAGIHWNALPETTSPAELIAAHLAAIDRHASSRGTSIRPVRQNLLGLCEAIEKFLVRRTG